MTDHPMKEKVTQKRLKQLFSYSCETGLFTRTVDCGWRAKAGDNPLGLDGKGYIRVSVDGVRYSVHRLIWVYVYGSFPKHLIDHIDGVKTNNRLINLREATISQNTRNSRISKNNSTGYKGVDFRLDKKKFRAKIMIDGVQIDLGSFDDPAEAYRAYCKAASKLHGRFANVG